MSRFIYKIGSQLFIGLVKIASLFNKRAKQLLDSRKIIFEIPSKKTQGLRLWIHAASLGEFEQARPVIEELKISAPQLEVICSFFSPSGYEVLKYDSLIDFAFYLPFESKKTATNLIQNINPDFALWVKYEFWLDYLDCLNKNSIPVFLIAASFQKKQRYFGILGNPYLQAFKNFKIIFTQTKEAHELLNHFQIPNSIHSGDPRFDRVIRGKHSSKQSERIAKFKGNKKLLILGSSYEWEELKLKSILERYRELKILIAPHFVDEKNIQRIEREFPNSIRFTITSQADLSPQVMILDTIGWLSSAYQYADASIIGGGNKKKGLHNILEPAVYGIPIAFGPQTGYFPETLELIESGQASCFSTIRELEIWLNKAISDASNSNRENWKQQIAAKQGIASKIAKEIMSELKY